MKYDFAGWATKNDLKCADGLVIKKDAFKVQDGVRVPLVWNHRWNSPDNVLGHAILENRDEGVYAYCYFNNTKKAQHSKEAVKHGDVDRLSIWANELVKMGRDVVHGTIREVSLVLAGANPGAFIESVIAHGYSIEEDDDEAIIYSGYELVQESSIDELKHSDDEDDDKEKSTKTVGEILDTLNDDQKAAVAILLAQKSSMKHSAEDDDEPETEDDDEDENEENTDESSDEDQDDIDPEDDTDTGDEDDDSNDQEEDEMKHNVFQGENQVRHGLSSEDVTTILEDAKRIGSLKETISLHMQEGGILAHAIDKTGHETHKGTQTYGVNDLDMLFPEFRTLNNQKEPVFISRNMEWVNKVMTGVHRSPFTRIKSVFADITEDDARARGYLKGKEKKEEVFTTLKRTTDPQTIYKKQKLDRDDIIDITDFDVVRWIRSEMRVMLNEEIARAILIGDGRSPLSEDKIHEIHVRPIVTDVPLYNIKVEVPQGTKPEEASKNLITSVIKSRKNYKGSGNPTFWTTEDVLTDLLLLEDGIGHKLYKTEAELATALRVSSIETVEVMENHKVDGKDLIGVIVNLTDYNVGADKGGEINTFDDFDIDFNQYKYLMETRISGALVKPFSAITLLKPAGSTPTPTP